MLSTGTGRKAAFVLSSLFWIAAWIAIDAPSAFAGDIVNIFDVRKTLPLDPSEPVYHDYYVNAGPEAGLKRGMFVTIVRRMPVHDPLKNKAQATLSVEVARMKIIHVERDISVARLVVESDAEDRPLLDYPGPMVGDELDLTTVSMEAPKIKPKPRVAATDSGEATLSSQAPVLQAPLGSPRVAPFIPLAPAEKAETMKTVEPGSEKLAPTIAPTTTDGREPASLPSSAQQAPVQAPPVQPAEAVVKPTLGGVPAAPKAPVEAALPESEKPFPVAPAPGMVRSANDDGKRS